MRGLTFIFCVGPAIWIPVFEFNRHYFRVSFLFFGAWIMFDDYELMLSDILESNKKLRNYVTELMKVTNETTQNTKIN